MAGGISDPGTTMTGTLGTAPTFVGPLGTASTMTGPLGTASTFFGPLGTITGGSIVWQATLQDLKKADGRWAFVIQYTNGAQTIRKDYLHGTLPDKEFIEKVALNEIADFDLAEQPLPVNKTTYQIGEIISLAGKVGP